MSPTTMTNPDKPTPENTPVPGGGSWCWSDTAPHWVPNLPKQPVQPVDAAALQTTDHPQE